MNLVIVESPTKTKSLSKYLGKGYEVLSSKGHIWNLPKSGLGVDVEHGYEPVYDVIHGKKKVIQDLQEAAKKAEKVYLATDLDREGEAIAFQVALAMNQDLLEEDEKGHVRASLSAKSLKQLKDSYQRVVFNQITKDAVQAAFRAPRGFDFNLLDAQKARRVLDRLVGYTLSPLLWKKIVYGLSAGRVQSVAVRLIVEREQERENFDERPYFRVFADTSKIKEAELVKIDGEAVEQKTRLDLFAGPYTYTSTAVDSKEKLDDLLSNLRNLSVLEVSSVERKETTRSPYPPFTTASLQRAASTFLNMSAKQTMRTAQNLYENGYITYHRTDSTNLASDFVQQARSYVKSKHGKQYVPESAKRYRSKSKSAQEAHEAIRPTQVGQLLKSKAKIQKAKGLGQREGQLYELIWKRAVASQMADAVYDNTTIQMLSAKGQRSKRYEFQAKGSILKFDGFLRVLRDLSDLSDKILPEVQEDQELEVEKFFHTEHATSPPPRYNEAALVKDLEKHGIGRPSTYAPIIDTIQERSYVEQEDRYFVPTDTGKVVNSFLVEHFSEVVDLNFTAEMEESLDAVAAGEEDWRELMDEFYKPFEKKVEEKEESIEKSDQTTLGEVAGENCPECGKPLVYKLGRYGKFISCSGYPDCDYSRNFVEKIGAECPECGAEHGGEIIVKRTRKGKKFWGCSRYPKCDWASWDRPAKT